MKKLILAVLFLPGITWAIGRTADPAAGIDGVAIAPASVSSDGCVQTGATGNVFRANCSGDANSVVIVASAQVRGAGGLTVTGAAGISSTYRVSAGSVTTTAGIRNTGGDVSTTGQIVVDGSATIKAAAKVGSLQVDGAADVDGLLTAKGAAGLSITGAGGLGVTYGVVAATFTGDGSQLTGITSTATWQAADALKMDDGQAVDPVQVDLSTVTSALAGKMDDGQAIPAVQVDLSTITTALSGKQASFVGVSSTCADGYFWNTAVKVNGVDVGGICTAVSAVGETATYTASSKTFTHGDGVKIVGPLVLDTAFEADTAVALAADPADAGSGFVSRGIDASGTVQKAVVNDTAGGVDGSTDPVTANVVFDHNANASAHSAGIAGKAATAGAADTAAALASAGTSAPSGKLSRGVDASGNNLDAHVDTAPTNASTNTVTSDGVFNGLAGKQASFVGISSADATGLYLTSITITNGIITGGKFVAGVVQVSSFTFIPGTLQWTNTTFGTCIINSSVTITTTGGPVEISFTGSMANTTTEAGVSWRVAMDGAPLPPWTGAESVLYMDARANNAESNASATIITPTAPSAGSHTFCIQAKTGTGTASMGNAASNKNSMWVREIH